MGKSNDQEPPDAAAPKTEEPDTAAPLPRIWEEPVGTGDPIPFDPALYEPALTPEELKELLEEEDS